MAAEEPMELENVQPAEPDVPAGAIIDDDDSVMSPDEEEVGKEIFVTADGGVVKKILVAGTGYEKPGQGDIVSVHYVGTLTDGTQFDSSRDRNEPFTFNLGEGRVIKGWDLGVATMRRGEKAVLTCKADYAYGENGSPPKIPPGATLNFEVQLLSWQSIKDISGDGGVIKNILTEGEGWEKPDDRDEVKVIYSARVQGAAEPFLSSGPEGVEFVVLAGLEGMKGVTTAIKTMKRGEHAHLVLQPEYAYGVEGREGVPPNSIIEVDLNFISWKRVEEVTPDGAVIKKTLVDSKEWKKPNAGAKVTVRVTGRLEDGTVFLLHPEGHELVFITDENQVPAGLDAAVMKMKVQETALVMVPPAYAYGDAGKPLEAPMAALAPDETPVGQVCAVPPGATVTYQVELVSTENAKESWDMNDEEKVAAAGQLKEKANQAYREGRTDRAISLYDKAVALITNDKPFNDELKTRARELRRTIHLNLAAAHIKLSQWKQAAHQAGKVLDLDPPNVKALYRRAQAYVGTGDYIEAEQDLKRGLIEEPANNDLLTLQRKLKVLMRDQAKKEASLYSRMFKAPKTVPNNTSDIQAKPDAGTPTEPAEPKDVAATMDVTPVTEAAA